MQDFLSIEKLVIDDSFINYCFEKDEKDFFYWNDYLEKYPFERDKITEAKRIVLGLYLMLQKKYENPGKEEDQFQETSFNTAHRLKRGIRYAIAVAAIFFAVLLVRRLTDHSSSDIRNTDERSANLNVPAKDILYETKQGERKLVVLSDSTKIWLNADTRLRIAADYGKTSRKVHLKGEALFDVIHNEDASFVVYTDKYEVTDLGTVFNVRAYPGDKESETSLIEGEVEIKVPGRKQKILLAPNQKIVISNESRGSGEETSRVVSTGKNISFHPLSYSRVDSVVLETAWVQNRFEINNEGFYQMKQRFERWFNVKIIIQDPEVGKYPFTATFKQENIHEVLQALQYAYHFNYKIANNEITLSK